MRRRRSWRRCSRSPSAAGCDGRALICAYRRRLRSRRARRAVGARPSRRRLAPHRHARHDRGRRRRRAGCSALDAQADDARARHCRRRRRPACSRTAAPCASRSTPARRRRTACSRRCWRSRASTARRKSSRASAALRASTARSPKPEVVLDQLGERWEIARNGYKPYACGVVLHPILDAMVALGEQRALKPDEIARSRGARASDRGAHHRPRRSEDRAAIEVQHLPRRCRRLSRPRARALRSSPTRAASRPTCWRCAARSR